MFDAPVDSLYIWAALAVGGVALFGVVGGLPTTPAPDAAGAADVVDRVAVAEYGATTEYRVRADAVRLDAHRIALKNDGGVSHATFAFGPVASATPDSKLATVAMGASPGVLFDTSAEFEAAVADAHTYNASWRPAAETLVVRRISWEGVDATIVVV